MTSNDLSDRLTALGLTAYEARVLTALTKLGQATVGEIHALSDVPRSAVYGALERLERRGLIDASAGRPRRFRALPPKAAVSKIESVVLSAVKDVKAGLEELASAPHRDVSDVRIWLVRGRDRVQERVQEIASSARSELFVAGTPSHILKFSGTWKRVKSRNVTVTVATFQSERASELAKLGEILRPRYPVVVRDDPTRMLFIRADRRAVLLASEQVGEGGQEDHTAFWTEDWPIVQFLNYLVDAMFLPTRKVRAVRKG